MIQKIIVLVIAIALLAFGIAGLIYAWRGTPEQIRAETDALAHKSDIAMTWILIAFMAIHNVTMMLIVIGLGYFIVKDWQAKNKYYIEKAPWGLTD